MGRFSFKKGSDDKGSNPYAQGGEDPYAKPMTAAQASYKQYQNAPINGLPGGPRAGGPPGGPRGGMSRGGSDASNETAPPPYNGGGGGGGYGNDKYGASGGYGSSRYDNSGYEKKSTRGPGGYGGLGGADQDDNRDALFGGARERYDQKQQQPPANPSSGTYGGSSSYGGYGAQRELTAEEQEEEEIDDIKRQIKETKLASANTAENSERIAASAVETALGTYARLGAQHERMINTENLLDKATLSTREADGKTKKLKSMNRSMFAVHVNNPFTAKKRTAEQERMIMEQHQADKNLRETTRAGGFQANARMEAGFKEIEAQRSTDKWQRASASEKSKYAFEDDSEDDDAENRIDESMARTAGHVSTLNSVAKLMGREIEEQNTRIDRLGEKTDAADMAARLNTERLKRIR